MRQCGNKEIDMLKPEDIIANRQRWNEFGINYEKNHIDECKNDNSLDQLIKGQQAQGKIVNPFIEKWLEGEIWAARNVLIIGMILTALIKGQIVIWAIMYIAYKGRVKKVRREAFEADQNGRKK